jgi:hypothetical protein
MKLGSRTQSFVKGLKTGFEATKKGYGKSVAFTQKYAPMAEQRLGRAAQVVVQGFNVHPGKNTVSMGVPNRPRKNMSGWGNLTFDI